MRFLVLALAAATLCTVYLALARAGWMPDKRFSAVVADAEQAGILATVGGLGWAGFVLASRPINGVESSLATVVGTLGGGVVWVLAMATWPWLLEPDAGVGTVATDIGRVPAATAAAYLFVVAVMGWALALGTLVFSQDWVWGATWHMIWLVPGTLLAVFAAGFLGAETFQDAPGGPRLFGLACAAVSGVGMVGLVGWFLTRSRRDVGP